MTEGEVKELKSKDWCSVAKDTFLIMVLFHIFLGFCCFLGFFISKGFFVILVYALGVGFLFSVIANVILMLLSPFLGYVVAHIP